MRAGRFGALAAALSLGLDGYKGWRGCEAMFRPFMEGLGGQNGHGLRHLSQAAGQKSSLCSASGAQDMPRRQGGGRGGLRIHG